jgi:putative MATE family efflux protein
MEINRVEEFIENPKKALLTLAVPITIGMLVQTAYSVVDTAFVGRLGADAIAALTFALPLVFIFLALAAGVTTGMNSSIARYIGSDNIEGAENAAWHGLIIAVGVTLLLFFLVIFYLEEIFIVFGAKDAVLELSIDYMSIMLLSIMTILITLILATVLGSQGDYKTAITIQVIALALNMILDPVFIYLLGFGVRGAAIATLISFSIGFLFAIYYVRKKSQIRMKYSSFAWSSMILKDIARVGLPASLMMMLVAIFLIFINKFMAYFGTSYVASLGIVTRLSGLASTPIAAVSIALLTIVGMFYGAKRYDILKDIVNYGLKQGFLITVVIGGLFFIIPYPFLRIFTADSTLIDIGSAYLRIEIFTFPLIAIGIIISRSIQGLGHGLPGLVIMLARLLIITVPLAYVFIFVFEFNYLSIPVAGIVGGFISAIIAFFWIKVEFNRMEDVEIPETYKDSV